MIIIITYFFWIYFNNKKFFHELSSQTKMSEILFGDVYVAELNFCHKQLNWKFISNNA